MPSSSPVEHRQPHDVDAGTVVDQIERCAAAAAATTAVICGADVLTYRELDRRSNRAARALKRFGVGPDSIVGLEAVPSTDVFVGLLAILKAGGAYLPIDPGLPRARVEFMLRDSAADLVLGTRSGTALNRWGSSGAHWIDLCDGASYAASDDPIGRTPRPCDLAYVMYTSGSTGPPKGVCIEHGSLASFARSLTRAIDFSPGKTILYLTTLSFDISIVETIVPLSRGMTVRAATTGECADIAEVRSLLARRDIDMLQLTPSRLRLLLADDAGLPSLGHVTDLLIGGEAFRDDLFARLRGCPFAVYNLYGPTETTVYSCVQRLRDGEPVTIGTPLENTRVYIVDEKGALKAPGEPGELLIAGEGLARGYLKQPDLTDARFAPTVFPPYERAYRTGDGARWTKAGQLEYLGRIDRPIKVRGYKVDLDGIEALLRAHPSVRDAVVTISPGADGDEHLCAHFVPRQEAAGLGAVLREYLSELLPAYSVPGSFVALASMPLTRNGKIDIKALPAPSWSEVLRSAPKNALEARVRDIWAEVLGIEPDTLGTEESFFSLGGTSLSAGFLLARVHRELGVDVPLRALFDAPTIARLAEYVAHADRSPIASLQSAGSAGVEALSSEQARVFFLQRMAPRSVAYNLAEAHRIHGELDLSRVEDTFRTLIARHESLRTSFHEIHGAAARRVHEHVPFALSIHDTEKARAPELLRTLIVPFDIERAPLLRAAILRIGSGRSVLMLDLHHLVADGLSRDILIREFCTLYRNEHLPPLPAQYSDYVVWQRDPARGAARATQRDYWLRMHRNRPARRPLPTDRQRPTHSRFAGARVGFDLDAATVGHISAVAADERATLFMALFALTSAYVSRLTQQDDVVLGTPVAGRRHPDLASVIGMFAGTLAVRVHADAATSFREHLRSVRATLLSAVENQEYQFDDLVAELGGAREPGRNPLFDVMLVLEETEHEPLHIPGVEIEPIDIDHQTSKVDLTFGMREVQGRLHGYVEYDTDLFDASTACLIRDGFVAFTNGLRDSTSRESQTLG